MVMYVSDQLLDGSSEPAGAQQLSQVLLQALLLRMGVGETGEIGADLPLDEAEVQVAPGVHERDLREQDVQLQGIHFVRLRGGILGCSEARVVLHPLRVRHKAPPFYELRDDSLRLLIALFLEHE